MASLYKNRILIVDDEKSNIVCLNHILSSDYTIYTAKDGFKAVQLANEYTPDLILLDIDMPERDGYDVLLTLKASEKTASIPVIFITGLSGSEDEKKGLALGAEDYIAKPFCEEIVKLRVSNRLKIVNQMRIIFEKKLAERSSRTRSEFLTRMNNEVNSKVKAIIGMSSLAQTEDGIKIMLACLKEIERVSREQLNIIEDNLE